MVSGLGAGSVLAGRYRLDSVLGRGGMGSVWLAHHLTLDSPVAIKLIDPEIAPDAQALERFMREAQAAAALRSPHVVQTLDYGVHDRIPYIAMELMEGESLAQRLARVRCLSPVQTSTVITHVARAVSKAHDMGIVHRDLKPDNVFLVRNDDEEIAKVLDFGIAKLTTKSLEATSQTRTGAVLGTPYYMSPEQAEGVKAVDHRADLWAMGVIAFECLLGQKPFQGGSIGELVLAICTRPIAKPSERGPVPVGFDAWFAKACARDPEQRFKSARELAEALRALTTGSDTRLAQSDWPSLPPVAGRQPFTTTTSSPVSNASSEPTPRARSVAWVGLAVGSVVLLGIGVYLWRAGVGSSPAPTISASTSQALAPASEPVVAPEPNPPEVLQAVAVSPSASGAATDDAVKPRKPGASQVAHSPHNPVGMATPRPPRPASAPEAPAPASTPPPARPPPPNPATKDEPTDFGF